MKSLKILPNRLTAAAGLPLGLSVGSGAILGLLILAQAGLLSQIIARGFLGGEKLDALIPQLAWLAGVVLLRAGVTAAGETSARFAAVRVKSAVRQALAEALLAQSPRRPGEERTGELVNTATAGVEALDAYFSQYLPQLALAALIPLLLLAAIFPVDGLTGLVLLVTAPLIPIFMILIGNLSESTTRRQWRVLSQLSAYFLDSLQGLAALKMLNRSADQARNVEIASQRYRQATLSVLRISFLSAFALELIATLSTAVIAVEISLRLLAGRLDFTQALFLLVLAPDFYLPLRTLGARFHAGAAGITAARRIAELLAEPAVPAPAAPAPLPPLPWTIRFERVSYTYPGRKTPALDQASFTLRPGEQAVLVGESGAGKTTVARLLLRFLRPDSGRIWINDTPLDEIAAEEWRSRLAWVPQDGYLFTGTLESNLRLARPGATRAELDAAVEGSGLRSAAKDLGTRVGEQGLRLSGGERQRLGIARALLKDAAFLLLDEPVSQVDPELEAALAEALARLSAGHTALTIAHHLTTISRAGQVLVLQQGKIVQSGSYQALRSAEGPFRELVAPAEAA